MEEIYLKVKIPTKYYNKIKGFRSKYDVPVESIEESIRYATEFKLRGLNNGIKVEVFSPTIHVTDKAREIADSIHRKREEEKLNG